MASRPGNGRRAWRNGLLVSGVLEVGAPYLVVMDARNERGLRAIIPADPGGKVRRLLPGREVADPWYTGDFEAAWSDVLTGCEALLRELDG